MTDELRTEGIAIAPYLFGRKWYVDAADGQDTNTGKSPSRAFATVGKAVSMASAGDTIYVAPGEYDEEVTIAAAKSNLRIIGVGGRGAAFIAPSDDNTTALTNHADDVTVVNLGLDGEGTGGGLVNTGRRFRAKACKMEGGAIAAKLTLGSVAQIEAGTRGKGDDALLEDCEFAWSTRAVVLECTDYGAVTQARFRDCISHNCDTAHFDEAVAAGGSAPVTFRDLEVRRHAFLRDEAAAAPTDFIDLNADNGNTGMFAECDIAHPTNEAAVLEIGTGVLWVANRTEAGVSTARPA